MSSSQPIHLFVPTFRVDETLEAIRECLERGWTGLGFKTVEFEKQWGEYTELPHSHFVNSATAGLHLAFKLLKVKYGWEDGDEVITTPLTFVSSNHAIVYENLKPVFADVDEYLCLDPKSVLERISKRTKAVLFVGLGGNTGQFKEVVKICRERGLKIILDAAHMSGTRWRGGKHVGSEADVTVFSYQAVKNLPTADSGMICFMDPELDSEVRKWTWLGINKDTYSRTVTQGTYKWMYDVEQVGFKAHGNSIMAAMGMVSLKYLDRDNAFRRQICSWYDELLKDNSGIKRIPMHPDCESSRHLYQIMVPKRDEVMLALNSNEIFPGVHYRDNTAYRMYAYGAGTCPRSHTASEQLISLPLHLRLSYDDVRRIGTVLNSVVGTKPSAIRGTERFLGHDIPNAVENVQNVLSKIETTDRKDAEKKSDEESSERPLTLVR